MSLVLRVVSKGLFSLTVSDGLRVFVATYFVMVLVIYLTKLMAARARFGVSLQQYGAVGSSQWIGRMAFEFFRWAILIYALLRVPFASIDDQLGAISVLERASVGLFGAALMLLGLAVVAYAHNYLGSDWRSGTTPDGPARLITEGPFAATRNPVFLGVQCAQLGFFLAAPNVFTLVALVAGLIAIQAQTRVEERHLAQRFGDEYQAYAARTRRWV